MSVSVNYRTILMVALGDSQKIAVKMLKKTDHAPYPRDALNFIGLVANKF